MKKAIFLSSVLCLLVVSNLYAKIWRVNNNPGITADFTRLQDAHDGAASGDTIYLESSPNSYQSLNCDKRLTIIGTGFFLDRNQGLQAFTLPSQVDNIYLNVGSAGSVIQGLSFNGQGLIIHDSDIVVRRNNFASSYIDIGDWGSGYIYIYSGASNILITQNYSVNITNNQASTGILISNNYIGYGAFGGDDIQSPCLNLDPNTVAIVKNNIFRRGTVNTYNTNISNNIMYSGFFTGSGNLVSNNLANETQFGTADGNKANINMDNVFVGAGSPDAFFKLKPGSPAIGAGYGSTAQNPVDAGMFGGSTPYVLSGIPAIPSIYFFANQPVGSNSDPIDVQIKVRSNN